jgi:hypothetical protein
MAALPVGGPAARRKGVAETRPARWRAFPTRRSCFEPRLLSAGTCVSDHVRPGGACPSLRVGVQVEYLDDVPRVPQQARTSTVPHPRFSPG